MNEARSAQLEHLDVLINCAALPAPLLPALLELAPAPPCAWLFEQTPEQELAHQGPVLLRIALASQEQCSGIAELLNAVHPDFCVLTLISRWPFADLTAHLRGASQATWSKGTCCGVLRYYDTRLFRYFCDQLPPHQERCFHAPVIQWHWIDHDSKAATLSGFDSRPDSQNMLSGLSLNDEQVLHLQAVSAAIRWFKNYEKPPIEHGFTSREAMIRYLITVHLDISRQKLEKRHHEDFIARALSEHLPLTLTRGEAT
ncbi:DUF4123 domain-containing protein [Pseudomonas sp. EA_65y_Pfl1_P113]|uniref:DUF4123 domain-containing protein n=1 Tax=Pseudomonas sp. EA_65y_Pfl1_P113 TaxID=3088692 RepID=UPI0030DBF5A0